MNDLIDISLIEQFSYCAKQAKNNLEGLKIKNPEMEDGAKKHKKNMIKLCFFKTIRAETKNKSAKRIIEEILFNNHQGVFRFSEVWVESKKYGIRGYCDEIKIEKGHVSIIEYKTTFDRSEKTYFREAPVNQIMAYYLAFSEYFRYDLPISLIVKRVILSIFLPYHDEITEEHLGIIKRNNTISSSSWDADLNVDVYVGSSSECTQLGYDNRIKEIVSRIKSKDFSHEGNKNKCSHCQYKESCDESLI
ncbi:PD-(D/E)XK nuclease family protein [Candidatus Woesearchaeota archaeon]|nr:PD-(D/E)XK nuclease family protein [Candidatus Woesearchaeota archaeon]